VAAAGLRGELVFPVPIILETSPRLLGYYRLLLGLSQKEFYSKGPFGRFKHLEESGQIIERVMPMLPSLCRSLIGTASALVDGVDTLTASVIDDLQLLTLGPQLRGGRLNLLGQDAAREVFELLDHIASNAVTERDPRRLNLRNAAGRSVRIEFSADPDVCIYEDLASKTRPLVSIEIKGGQDVSNVHNRLGEAEKSHQKARKRGFFEFWTILGAAADMDMARRESPTTGHFFSLPQISDRRSAAFHEFRDLVRSILGIA